MGKWNLFTLSGSIGIAGLSVVWLSSHASAGSCTTGDGTFVGDGTTASPYEITTTTHLEVLRDGDDFLGCVFEQQGDIPFGGTEWNDVIAGSANPARQFTGTYDGQGFTISGLNIVVQKSKSEYVGLFGYVGAGGVIKNLTFTGDVTSEDNDASGSTGSIVGVFGGDLIENVAATGDVSGYRNVGGLVGNLDVLTGGAGVIRESYASGNVTGMNQYIGGLVGLVNGTTRPVSISDSFASGHVGNSNSDQVGGLIGYTLGDVDISDSYSTGAVEVEVDGTAGGLVAVASGTTTFSESFWDKDSSGLVTSAGGIGKSTAEMQTFATFGDAGWSIADGYDNETPKTWGICSGVNDGYPFLTAFYSSDPCVNPPSPSAGDSSRPTATFHFRLPDGTECSLISPQLVYTERTFILPGSSAPCRTPGSELLGWAVPHHDWYFAPGATVYVVDSQVFTAVLRQPTIRVTWSANVALEDPCLKQSDDPASNAGAAQRTQTEYLHRPDLPADTRAGEFPSVDDAFAPQQAPCTPPGYVLEGWSALNSDAPAEVAPGDPLAPAIQQASPTGAESRFVFQAKWVPQQTPSTTSWAGFFRARSDTLSDYGQQQLQAILDATASRSGAVTVQIVGVSDSLETADENAQLADTRARTLQALLQEAGIDATYTTTTDPALVQPEQAQSGKPLTTVRITSTR